MREDRHELPEQFAHYAEAGEPRCHVRFRMPHGDEACLDAAGARGGCADGGISVGDVGDGEEVDRGLHEVEHVLEALQPGNLAEYESAAERQLVYAEQAREIGAYIPFIKGAVVHFFKVC